MSYRIKRSITVFLLVFVGLSVLFTTCGTVSQTEPFSSTLVLTNFTYTGAGTVYFGIALGGQDHSYFQLDSYNSSILLDGTSTSQTGTFDVTVAQVVIEDPDFDTVLGLDVWLFIASDEDASSDLSAGDRLMPVFSLTLPPGETVEIDGLTLDFAVPSASWDFALTNMIRLNVNFNVPAVIDATHPLIFRLDNAGNADFTLAPNHRYIEITDPRLAGDMVVYLPDAADTYFYAMAYDRDGNGLDTGDNATETDQAVITRSFTTVIGDTGSPEFDLILDSYTLFQ